MWWKPTRDAFTPVTSALLPVIGLGKLDIARCGEFERHLNTALLRAEAYLLKTEPARVPPFLGPSVQMAKHSLVRLQSVAMNFKQMAFQVRDIQRSWMEVVAVLDYMEIYKPRMDATDGTVITKHHTTAATLGTFTSDLRVAQDHFQAGLPCWLIQPASAFVQQNILKLCEPEPPHSTIELTPHKSRPLILAEGRAGTSEKYNIIHRRARNFMRYPDPFDHGTTININVAPEASTSRLSDVAPATSSSIGPVRQQSEKARRGSGRGSGRGLSMNSHGRTTKSKPYLYNF